MSIALIFYLQRATHRYQPGREIEFNCGNNYLDISSLSHQELIKPTYDKPITTKEGELNMVKVLRTISRWNLILILASLLAGCGGQAQAQLGQSSPAIAETSATLPTATSTDVSIITPTSTVAPSPTNGSTASPTATAMPVPPTSTSAATPTPTPLHPLTIESLRQQEFPGSDISIEDTLEPGSNYDRYIASYLSEGSKIYALLTVPTGEKPSEGWPVIVFNHGYIPPGQYRTTERYVDYVDALARNGYIVFKSDYRGHGNSEGQATGGYGSPAYTVDVLNAVVSIKKYSDADPNRIGMWGHSMGGHITLRSMVTSKDIKVGVIWAGVVGPYPDLLTQWRLPNHDHPEAAPNSPRRWREDLVKEYGSPEENPEFWAAISPNTFVADISGPVQLHHSPADTHVPVEFSETLFTQLQDSGQLVDYHTYEHDDHNISNNFTLAMNRSIAFLDTYLKSE
jgi:fermentation-respiration switch protein FrsA (DUF1100 family)